MISEPFDPADADAWIARPEHSVVIAGAGAAFPTCRRRPHRTIASRACASARWRWRWLVAGRFGSWDAI
jgi:hypothetical protein